NAATFSARGRIPREIGADPTGMSTQSTRVERLSRRGEETKRRTAELLVVPFQTCDGNWSALVAPVQVESIEWTRHFAQDEPLSFRQMLQAGRGRCRAASFSSRGHTPYPNARQSPVGLVS